MVSPNEGKRSAAKRAAGSCSASESTAEAGELDPSRTRGREARRQVTTPLEGNMTKAPDFESVSTRQQRIAGLAKQSPQMAFTSLNQYLDLSWLHEA